MHYAVEIKLGVQPAGEVKVGFEGKKWMGVPEVSFERGCSLSVFLGVAE